MKLLLREIEIRRATQQLLQKKSPPDQKLIAKLTGEIFELQRTILTTTLRVDNRTMG
ncbi:MAG: hypothetical protein K9K37_11390 [Desulfocapsa sp.]|nr:hypothetical protein [Desulfocapsa sp.]